MKANVIAVKATEIGGVNAKKCLIIYYYYILFYILFSLKACATTVRANVVKASARVGIMNYRV